jgi:zinc protease
MPFALRALLICVVAFTTADRAPAQPLPSDPALVTGALDNGLRYIVRQHSVPPGRAVIWIHFDTGSLNETERQRGIAHYLEHMAFNGSTHFEPGSLVPYFQSMGMTFGRDQNAFTSYDQTTYQLSLPDTKPETLGKGMTFFADIVSELSLLPSEIDAERQIIQEERRRSLSGRQRVGDIIQERMTPGSLFALRQPIGTEQTINAFTQQDFKDYYGRWYGPSNATVMVVADADPAEVIGLIKEKFGAAPKRARATPQDPKVKAYDRSFAIVASDPEIRSEEVRIVRIEPARPPTLTEQQYRDDLVAGLGTAAMNRRLSEKVAKGGTSFLSASVGLGNEASALYAAEISGSAAPGQWHAALEQIALELQRARAFGFTARELDDVRKELISGAERAVKTEATTPAQGLIRRINGNVAQGEPTLAPSQRLALLNKHLPTITTDEVAARFAREFDPKAVAFVAVLPADASIPTEAQLLEIGIKALAVSPQQEAELARAASLMETRPPPGKVSEGAEHEVSKVWSGWLTNNVRVHHRFIDTRKDQATVNISLIGGEVLETAANRGITGAAQIGWARPATSTLSSTDIRELMTGKKVDVRGGGGGGGRGRRGGGGGSSDSISLTISGSPDELETGFQLAYLLLTDPRIEDAAFSQFQIRMREMLDESHASPMMIGGRAAAAAPFPDDESRTKPLTVQQVDKLTLTAAQAWLDKLIRESPIEVVIVGDIPRDRALDLAARYLGALPPRERISTHTNESLRHLKRPAGPRMVEKTIDSPTKQAFVLSGFYGADESNLADARALSMAARILSSRMTREVREQAQLVYSIGAGSRAAVTYPGFGVFSASAPTDPAKVPALVDKLASMYEAFATNGPSEDEMIVARKQFANNYEQELREPAYWSGRLSQLTFRGRSLDDIVNEPEAYQSLTADQVRQAFAKYYSKDNSIVVIAKPSAQAEAAAAAATPLSEQQSDREPMEN